MFTPITNDSQSLTLGEFLSQCLSACSQQSVFRGQADSAWGLTPSGFRASNGASFDNAERSARLNQYQGAKFIENAKALRQLLKSREAIDHRLKKSEYKRLQLFVISQHFGVPTPLLDWTQSPLIALFMASFNSHSAQEIAIFRLDRNLLSPDVIYEDYKDVSFNRISAQRGGVSVVGTLQGGNLQFSSLCLDEYIFSKREQIESGEMACFVSKVCVRLSEGDSDRIEEILKSTGVDIETMFPNSGYWKAQEVKRKMGF
jgi:hypothetical protein